MTLLESGILAIQQDRDRLLRESSSLRVIYLIQDMRQSGWKEFVLDNRLFRKLQDLSSRYGSYLPELVAALKANTSIVRTVISRVDIRNKADLAFPLFLAIGCTPSLCELKIEDCQASAPLLSALSLLIKRTRCLKKLEMDLSCNYEMDTAYFAFNEIPDALRNHPSIAELSLSVDEFTLDDDASVDPIRGPCFDDFFQRCSSLSQLSRFWFCQNFSDDCTYTSRIDLSWVISMQTSTLDALLASGIRHVKLGHVQILDPPPANGGLSSQGPRSMIHEYSELQILELQHVFLSASAMSLLQEAVPTRTPALHKLKINDATDMGCFPNGATIECVGSIIESLGEEQTTIKVLEVPGYEMSREMSVNLCRLPGTMQHLSELFVDQLWLSDEAALTLSNAISSSHSLKVLGLENCRIAADGCLALSRALALNPTLTKLTMDGMFLGLPSECRQTFFAALTENTKLKMLDVSQNELTRTEFFSLTQALSAGSGLEELVYTGWSGNGTGYLVLGRSLFENENESLKSICVDGSLSLSERGESGIVDCQVFGNALEQNTTLEKLQLSDCKLSDVCCSALLNGLVANRMLKEVKLGGNSFGDESCEVLANVLHRNTTLQVVDLTTCVAGDDGMISIVNALRTNQGLRYFAARPAHIDEYGEGLGCYVIEMLEMNFSLEYFSVPCALPQMNWTSTFYLRLNQLRRGDIVQGSSVGESREAALHALSQCLHDLDCIVYIVRASAQALFAKSAHGRCN